MIKLVLPQGCKVHLRLENHYVFHYINRIKKKNNMIISTGTEKELW